MTEFVRDKNTVQPIRLFLEDYDSLLELTPVDEPGLSGPSRFSVVAENISQKDFYSERFLTGLFETISNRIKGVLILQVRARLGAGSPEESAEVLLLPKYEVDDYGYSNDERKIFANFNAS